MEKSTSVRTVKKNTKHGNSIHAKTLAKLVNARNVLLSSLLKIMISKIAFLAMSQSQKLI